MSPYYNDAICVPWEDQRDERAAVEQMDIKFCVGQGCVKISFLPKQLY